MTSPVDYPAFCAALSPDGEREMAGYRAQTPLVIATGVSIQQAMSENILVKNNPARGKTSACLPALLLELDFDRLGAKAGS